MRGLYIVNTHKLMGKAASKAGGKVRSGWSFSRMQIGDSVKVGLALKRHCVEQVRAGTYKSFRHAVATEKSKFF
jgi:hypothetical protein